MKKLLIPVLLVSLSGCAAVDTVKKYWPRSHDPEMFDQLVSISFAIEHVDCEKPDWSEVVLKSSHLARYTEWRGDPQAENLKGLLNHAEHMSHSSNKTFCELGKKTAEGRVDAAMSAWKGR